MLNIFVATVIIVSIHKKLEIISSYSLKPNHCYLINSFNILNSMKYGNRLSRLFRQRPFLFKSLNMSITPLSANPLQKSQFLLLCNTSSDDWHNLIL